MKSLHSFRISALAAALVMAAPFAHAADAPSLTTTKFAPATQVNQTYDRFIITYRDGTTERGNSASVVQNVKAAIARTTLGHASTASSGATIAPLSVSYQRKLAVGADLVRTSRKLNQNEANALILQIAADPSVRHVQPDYIMHAVRDIAAPKTSPATAHAPNDAVTPNDPDYQKYQWDFFNATGGADIDHAWSLADGTGVTVAILDTGITAHPDVDTSLADDGYDFITDAFMSGRATDGRAPGGWDLGDWTNTEPYQSECTDANNPPETSSWHGTNVASVTGAELTDNGVGMAGIAHGAKVLPVRVLGHCGGATSDIADAIEWASGGHVDGVPDNTHVAQVINMSLGGGGTCAEDGAMGQAIEDAISRGTTVVVAAGNSNDDAANYSPSSCPGVISVASNGITGKRAFYSNYGKTVTLSAPGGGIYVNDGSSGQQDNPNGFIWAAINPGTTTPMPASADTSYGGMAGTSQATPHVTGTIALMLSATEAAGMPTPTPAQIKDLLVNSARPFPVTEDQPIGAGIVDAAAAVNAALGNDNGGTPPPPPPQSIELTKGVILPNQSTGYGGSILYSIVVPAGATTLNIRSIGGSGDATLYVKAGSAPSADGSNADFSSAKPGNNEAVVIPQPQATTYYILLAAAASPTQVNNFTNVSVLANYNP